MSSCRNRRRPMPLGTWLGALAGLLAIAAAAPPDPQAGLYGNTVICIDAGRRDVGHLWLNPDGTFVLLTPAGLGTTGQAKAAAPQDDGAIPICLHLARTGAAWPATWPMPAIPPLLGNDSCWVLGPHDIGDRWRLIGQGAPPGMDLLLIAGRR